MLLRILLGFPFVYLLSGFPLARLFLPEEKTISLKLVLTSFVCSLFLTYPAAVLTTIFEGQSAAAIYSVHLPHSLFSLALISLLTFLVLLRSNKNWWKLSLPKLTKTHAILALIIALYSFFVFWNLGRADVVGDDFDLGYQAYNLHDGIQAARRAYILSFATHPPLFMTIKHFGMQLFSPFGLETLQDWMFRGVEGIMGIGTILATFLVVEKYLSRRAALLAALFLAVNNYLVFFGRYYEREIYYLPFIVLACYFCLESLTKPGYRKLILTGFLLGAGLLIKTSAVIAISPVVLILLLNRKFVRKIGVVLGIIFLIYVPIVIFNILMYLNTGYLDGTFSRIFRIYHPLNTQSPPNSYLVNPPSVFFLLGDLLGWPLFIFSLLSFLWLIMRRQGGLLFRWQAILMMSALLFFMFSPMRAYYLVIFVLPLTVFTAMAAREIWGRVWGKAVIMAVIFYSVIYTYNSNLVSRAQAYRFNDYGHGAVATLATNWRHWEYSYSAAGFSPELGWKTLKQKLDRAYRPGDCLTLDQPGLDLPVRHYLRTHDLVRQALLGKQYLPAYPMCEDLVEIPGRKIRVYYNSDGKIGFQ